MSWLTDPGKVSTKKQELPNYEERLKLPIGKRLSYGLLKEAEAILIDLYKSGGISDYKRLSSQTNSLLFLLDELSSSRDNLVSYKGKNIVLTDFWKAYVENLKPDAEVINVDKMVAEKKKIAKIPANLEAKVEELVVA